MHVKSTAKKKKIKKPRQIPLKGIRGKIKPTAQDVKIAEGLILEGKKKGQALIDAGIPEGSARSNSALILGRPGVQEAMRQALHKANVDLDRIAMGLDEGLKATKIISANLLVTGSEGEKELPCVNGFIDATEKPGDDEQQKAFVRVEDFQTRHKYLETSIKLLDLFPREGTVTTEERVTVSEEKNLIDQAEQSAGSRDVSRYMVRRETTSV